MSDSHISKLTSCHFHNNRNITTDNRHKNTQFISASSETRAQDLKVESLDDLFADDEPITQETNTTASTTSSVDDGMQSLNTMTTSPKPKSKPMEIPLEDNDEEVNNVDLEKALEAKFDELFGTDED